MKVHDCDSARGMTTRMSADASRLGCWPPSIDRRARRRARLGTKCHHDRSRLVGNWSRMLQAGQAGRACCWPVLPFGRKGGAAGARAAPPEGPGRACAGGTCAPRRNEDGRTATRQGSAEKRESCLRRLSRRFSSSDFSIPLSSASSLDPAKIQAGLQPSVRMKQYCGSNLESLPSLSSSTALNVDLTLSHSFIPCRMSSAPTAVGLSMVIAL